MNGGAPPLADALRVAAAAWRRLRSGDSLDRALVRALDEFAAGATAPVHPRLAAAAKDIVYSAPRQLALIEAMLDRLSHRAPDPPVAALLAVTLGQLLAPRQPTYAIVDQSVQAAKLQAETRTAAGFVNGVLRNAIRRLTALRTELQKQPTVAFNAPRWWIDRMREAEPAHFAQVLQLQQQVPPLVLRVNRRHGSVEAYLRRLHDEGIEASQVGPAAV